jgi:hypothetical protein
MNYKLFSLLLLLAITMSAYRVAAQNYTISGYITDRTVRPCCLPRYSTAFRRRGV